jgi:alpha-ketoglutarate-dependent taurine dioxygenase
MKTQKIHPGWGEIWSPTKEELFSLSPEDFRSGIYKNRLLIIKGVGQLSRAELYWLMDRFGKPWDETQYLGSQERFIIDHHNDQRYVLTHFSNNTTRKIKSGRMAWHSDIPNHATKPFPIRFLYMNRQPSSEYGQTEWLNIDLDQLNLSSEELQYFEECTVEQQSWWNPGSELRILPVIKTHPILEERKSLRLNYFVNPAVETSKDAWIRKSFYKGQEIKNTELIGNTINRLLDTRPDLFYRHVWDIGDMAIYDNWSFVHGRTPLVLEPGEIREFLRSNIDHETSEEFSTRQHFQL